MVKRFLGIGIVGVLAVLAACNVSAASGDCTTLPTCCSQLTDTSSKNECNEVVALQDATSCGEAQSDFENDNLCQVATTSSGSTSGCAGLTACCGSLPDDEQSACGTIAGAGDDTLCTEELTTYTSSGACKVASTSSGGTGCSGLSSCCGSLSAAEQPSCSDLASAGDDTVCSSELMTLQADGSCGGTSGSGTGGGKTTSTDGSGCSGLSDCCASLASDEQEGCNEIVSEGNAEACLSELTVYKDSGSCGGSTSPGSGSGSSGGDCSELDSCCSSLDSGEESGCSLVVSEGNAEECSAELTSLKDAGSCGN